MLISDLSDYGDTYIVGKGTIDVLAAAANENDKGQINVGLRNNDPFRSCISKSADHFNTADLDIVMPMLIL